MRWIACFPKQVRPRKLLRLLSVGALSAVFAACDIRQPVAPTTSARGHDVAVRSTDLAGWSAERLALTTDLAPICESAGRIGLGRLYEEMCGYISEGMTIPLGPGDHLIRVRISGRIRMEGGASCNAFGTTDFGPLGVPNPTIPSLPFMRTTVSWGGQVYRELFLEPVTADSSVVEGTIDVSGGGVIGIFRYHPLLSYYAGHENNCKLFGNPVMEVFVRDKVDEPRLRIACDPNPVTRGEETVCEVTAAEGAVKPTAWEFSGRGVRIARPAAEAHETVWSGIMAVGGYVRVSASVGSRQPVSDSVLIEVLPRNWRFQYPDAPAPEFVGLPDLPYPPIISLGERLSDGDLGMYWPAKYSWPSRPADGINAGFAFVSGPLTFDEPPVIHINQGLKPDDPFFLAQRGVVRGRTYVYVPCDRMHMDSAANFVVKHEYGHHEVEKQFWESAATAQFVDSMVVYNPAGRAVVDTPSIAPLRARRRVLQDDFDRSNTLVLRCQLHPIDER